MLIIEKINKQALILKGCKSISFSLLIKKNKNK